MQFVVTGADDRIRELKACGEQHQWITTADVAGWKALNSVDAFFNLNDEASAEAYGNLSGTIFINSVVTTIAEANMPDNVIRLNGWAGFISRPVWEMAGAVLEKHKLVCDQLGKKIMLLPDEPGFVSARVISMIINEAFFAKEDGVSEEKEIDIAMKLGTNYPLGPFEWGKKIGLSSVAALLKELSKKDPRYTPCKLLLESRSES